MMALDLTGQSDPEVPWRKQPKVVVARPPSGGIAYVGSACADYLKCHRVEVDEVVLPNRGSPAIQGLRCVWAHRRAIRKADIVHVELGVLAVPTFWFAVWAAILRNDLLVVAHDAPLLVKHPGSGAIRASRGMRDILAFRVFAPLLDAPLLSWIKHRTRVFAFLSEEAARLGAQEGLSPGRIVRLGGPPVADNPVPSKGRYVLTIGRLGPDKGLDILLQAWAEIGASSPLPLMVVGDADDKEWLAAQQAKIASLSNILGWRGWVADDEFEAILAEAAIVVIPYLRSNPASGVLIRAKLHGRAIIASRVRAVQGEIDDQVDGLLVEPGDAKTLASALKSLIFDPSARDRIGHAAAKSAALEHTWSGHIADLYGGDLQHSGFGAVETQDTPRSDCLP